MNAKQEAEKVVEAISNLAGTLIEIIDARLQDALKARSVSVMPTPASPAAKSLEGWVGKPEVAKHLNVSMRTLHTLMKKGVIPYVRFGGCRRLLFKLGDVDQAMIRRFQQNGLWLP